MELIHGRCAMLGAAEHVEKCSRMFKFEEATTVNKCKGAFQFEQNEGSCRNTNEWMVTSVVNRYSVRYLKILQ